jgi:enoyl-CoA hydratase
MAEPGGLVRTSVTDKGVGLIRLTDRDRRNALSKELSDELAASVARVLDQQARAIVLSADPPVFSAGGSLDGLANREFPLSALYAGFLAVAGSPVPTIAAVDGPAVGAGVNLALACDVILASPAARFDPRFLDLAIHPGGGHLWRLARRIGAQGVSALVLCGDVLTGVEAAERGLAWRCVPADELEPLAMRFAERAAVRSAELVRRTKASLMASMELTSAEDAVALELRAQQWSVEQPKFAEAVRTVRERLAASRTR